MILCSQNQQFFFKDQRGLPNLIYRTPLKKDNIQAVLFNTMKLRYKTTKETDEFYYFEKDLATQKTSFDNLKAKISSSYELVINFNKSKYVND